MKGDKKFRVWDKIRKKWADWVEIYTDGGFNIGYISKEGGLDRVRWGDCYDNNIDLLGEDKHGKWNYDKDCVLMQSTGLKDSKGKEIYEGDIVKANPNNMGKEKFTVVWGKKRAGFRLDQKCNCKYYAVPNNRKEIEVIGNIYENPELLKGEKNG